MRTVKFEDVDSFLQNAYFLYQILLNIEDIDWRWNKLTP